MASIGHVQHLQIPLQDIIQGTKNFHDEHFIGLGGFGRVYRGVLPRREPQCIVAIKRLDHTSTQGQREFMMEIAVLSCYRHENLVSLVGFCDESGEKILVYEYASNGSLDKFLHHSEISWIQRLKICLDAARGLKYLHDEVGLQHRIIHRDIKSSNILLDENWKAKISDFGLSKIGPANVKFTFLVSNACGTLGFVDPQYVKTGILTKESDVFSFGVVLFEVLCGRLACSKCNDESRFLFKLAQQHYEEGTLDTIIDPNLQRQMNSHSQSMFSTIAYQCVKKHREERPTMSLVVDTLQKALVAQQETTRVDEGNLIRDLNMDLRRDVKPHPCFPLLKKVPMFAKTDDQVLNLICQRLKPALYTEDSYIVRNGDPIHEALFIMRGKLLTMYNERHTGLFNSTYLRAGDICGEEIITWAFNPHSSPNLPISTASVLALTEVEAFVLSVDDLKLVASQFPRVHSKQRCYNFRFLALRAFRRNFAIERKVKK